MYNQLLSRNINEFHKVCIEGTDATTGMRLANGEGGGNSHQYDSYGQVIEYPAATLSMSHQKSTSRQGSLSQVKSQNLHTVVHEIPIRKGKRKFEEKEEEQDAENPIRYQRFKTWTQSESAGSWAGSSINDSWEEDNIDADAEIRSSVRKSLPRRDSDRTLSSFGDNQSIDETQSCIAVEGEMTLAEYLQMADSGITLADDGEDRGQMRIIGEDIDNDGRGFKLEEEVAEVEADNDASGVSDDDRSIATSLFVEVASVDGYGSYFGYGGSSDSDNEVHEFYDCDQDDRLSSGSLSAGPYNHWSRQGLLSSHSNSERSSTHRHKYKSRYKDKNARSNDSNSSSNILGKDNSDFSQLDENVLRSSTFTRHTPLVTSNWMEDGYDAASETGKGDLTDGMEEENAIEEDMEDKEEYHHNNVNNFSITSFSCKFNKSVACSKK